MTIWSQASFLGSEVYRSDNLPASRLVPLQSFDSTSFAYLYDGYGVVRDTHEQFE